MEANSTYHWKEFCPVNIEQLGPDIVLLGTDGTVCFKVDVACPFDTRVGI